MDLHARIRLRLNGQMLDTTVGRVLLFEVIPPMIPFERVNRVMNKKEIRKLIDDCYRKAGVKQTVILADRLKDVGYHYATLSGISISVADMKVPPKKKEILRKAEEEVRRVEKQYVDGLITDGEKYNKLVDIWAKASEDVAQEMMEVMGNEDNNRPRPKGGPGSQFQSHLYDVRFRRPGQQGPDAPIGRHAGADGQALRGNHRDADPG